MKTTSQIEQQRQQLTLAVQKALEFAGPFVDGAEVSMTKVTGLNVSSRFAEVENVEFNSDGALGIVVYKDHCKGSASSTDLSEQAIKNAVQAAIDIAYYTSPDPYVGLADKALMAFTAPDLDLYHPYDCEVDDAIAFAVEAEKSALNFDPQISNTEGASFAAHRGIKVYGNSYGMLQSYCSSRYSLSCCTLAERDGQMERDYAYTIARDMNALQSAQWVGEECAKRTLSRLGGRKLSTMTVPVLFAAEVAVGLIAHLVSAISGGNLYRKSSFLLDHLGQSIFPSWFAINEAPHIRKGLASSAFDNDGVRTQDRVIVDQGILRTYLLGSYSARKLGMVTTGHAGGIHNWFVKSQGGDFAAMLKRLHTGLLVTELMGQGVNIITGDYSRGAAGFWVENGEIQYPVSEITIAGNLREMFKQIVAVGDDRETRGSIQTGSILIEKMKIAGQ